MNSIVISIKSPGRFSEEKLCANDLCEEPFLSKGDYHIYCSHQCRHKVNNESKKEKKGLTHRDFIIAHNDEMLGFILQSQSYPEAVVPEQVFILLEVEINVGTNWEENLITGNPILWFHQYGLELFDEEARTFLIHHRTNPLT